jgi:HK97 family phage major capsid protein
MVIAKSKLTGMDPLRLIQSNKQWMDQTPEIDLYVRTVIEAGDTTTSGWASQLVPNAQQLENEYLDLLRPMTLLGRIPGFNNVPFNVTVPIGTADGTHSWVGEDVSAPVGKLTVTSATLEWAKTASIIAITKELAMLSSPQAEGVVRNALLKGNAAYLDVQFVSLNAAVTKSSPAGILNGISQTLGTGTTPATFLADLNTLLGKLATNNQNIGGLVLMTSLNQLLPISLMRSSLGTYLYPDVSVRILPDGSNGSIGGIPIYASNAIAGTTASTSRIIAMVASEVLMADASGAQIDISTEASLEMNTNPLAGDQSPLTTSVAMKSLWQAGLVGIKVTRPITWKVARSSAVEYLNNTNYLTA